MLPWHLSLSFKFVRTDVSVYISLLGGYLIFFSKRTDRTARWLNLLPFFLSCHRTKLFLDGLVHVIGLTCFTSPSWDTQCWTNLFKNNLMNFESVSFFRSDLTLSVRNPVVINTIIRKQHTYQTNKDKTLCRVTFDPNHM